MISATLRKELKPEDITVIVDTREQTPLNLKPLQSITGTLDTGDYSVVGLTRKIAIERKSLQDFIACVGRERERFDREMHRILAYPIRAMIIEADICQIQRKEYRGEVHPNAALGSAMGWMALGLPIIWAGTHELAGELVTKFIYVAAKRCWAELWPFLEQQAIGVA